MSQYVYAEGKLVKEGDFTLLPNETGLNIDLVNGVTVDLPAESLVVYTDFE